MNWVPSTRRQARLGVRAMGCAASHAAVAAVPSAARREPLGAIFQRFASA